MSPTAIASSGIQGPSKRWTHFHAALQLAIQRAAHKWTYADFADCFSLWCEEQPDGAVAVFNTVSGHMEKLISENCDELLEQYEVRSHIDILHAVVTEARARKQHGQLGKDVWHEDLQPRMAVRARTVPLLTKERNMMKETLEALEEENRKLQKEMQNNDREREENDAKLTAMFDILNDVYDKWSRPKFEEMETWTIQIAETL